MTFLNSRYTLRLLLGTLAMCCANWNTALHAEIVVFQFRTTVHSIAMGPSGILPAGIPDSAPLVVTYAFDTALQNGTGPFGINSTTGSYGPIAMMIQVGGETITAPGPFTGISVINNAGSFASSDEYDVRVGDFATSIGTVFGTDVIFFRFLLADESGLMFNSTALPSSTAFATFAQFQQTELDLFDSVTGESVLLWVEEFPNTPPAQLTPFSLTELGDAAMQIGELGTEVVNLNLGRRIEVSLLDPLKSALHALAGHQKNGHNKHDAQTALDNIQSFINGVNAQRGKAITEEEAVSLIVEANAVLFLLGVQP